MELYLEFKKKHPEVEIGFSSFCSIRQDHCAFCVPVTSSGMHNVCVCEKHQNAKLMFGASPISMDHKDAMSKIVCDLSNRQCMLLRCPSCPGK